MKFLVGLMVCSLGLSCSSAKLTDHWRNLEYKTISPKRVLVIGVTPNLEARKAFEFQLANALNAYKINAMQSVVAFESAFHDAKQTEAEIKAQVDTLLSVGYDTVLMSAVKGVNEKASYSSKSAKTDYRLRKFIGYYLLYQEALFNQDYYTRYKVYTIETSLYHLEKVGRFNLVWTGFYDLVDPTDMKETIDLYVKAVIKALEKEHIIEK